MAAQQRDDKSAEMISELTAVSLNEFNIIFEHEIPEFVPWCTRTSVFCVEEHNTLGAPGVFHNQESWS